MERPKKFAKLFKEARKEKSLTYRAVSKLTKASPTVLVQYEKGQSLPSTPILEKLCQVFGWDFKSTFVLVQDERNPDKTLTKHFQLAEPQYPAIRKILLDLYDANLHIQDHEKLDIQDSLNPTQKALRFATKDQIEHELQKYPYHFIETMLLYRAYQTKYQKEISQQGALEFYKYFVDEEDLESELKSSIHFWGYDLKQNKLLIETKRPSDQPGPRPFSSIIYELKFAPIAEEVREDRIHDKTKG
jgi:transcriptional regulator with XRE-family HTH domain